MGLFSPSREKPRENELVLRFYPSPGFVTRVGEFATRFPCFVADNNIVDEERFVADCVLACMDAYLRAVESGGQCDIHVIVRPDHPSGAVFSVPR